MLEEEATEDIERLGGSQPLDIPYRFASVVHCSSVVASSGYWYSLQPRRIPARMRHFEDELAQVVALGVLHPALDRHWRKRRQLRSRPRWCARSRSAKFQLRDVTLGTSPKSCSVASFWARHGDRSPSVDRKCFMWVTMWGIVIALDDSWQYAYGLRPIAAILPLIINRLKIDPAVVSAPLITTFVDGTGLVIYFSIAKRLLQL